MTDAGRPLSVTEAMQLAKRALESLTLRVVGEVSEFTDRPRYKAVYFTVADGGSVMPCLIWRDAYAASGVQLKCGMLVEIAGQMTAYPPKGRLQFQARSLNVAGEGVLRLQVAAVARKLEAEGLMRADRKRELPAWPLRIGLVTSPRGKAVHDVIRTLCRRYPLAELVIAGVAVEGTNAVPHIIEGLEAVGRAGVDVIILGRGGGSYEDLMPFNDEKVARAIVASPVPVVTGIGHEPDTSIADMVADLRASTPTAAAEKVAPAADEIGARVAALGHRLGRGLLHAARAAERRVAVIESRSYFHDPSMLFAVPAQRVDAASDGLARALPAVLTRDRVRVDRNAAALAPAAARLLERSRDRLGMMTARLGDLSPLGILGRGYAVCYDESGRRVVRSVREITAGDRVTLRLADGSALCTVDDLRLEETDG